MYHSYLQNLLVDFQHFFSEIESHCSTLYLISLYCITSIVWVSPLSVFQVLATDCMKYRLELASSNLVHFGS